MAVLEVLTYPDERLRQPARAVTGVDDVLRDFIRDLEETMDSGPPSVGIAAPQVGHLVRVAIVDVSGLVNDPKRKRPPKSSCHGRLVLINPEIVERQGEAVGREGCLSVPDYTGNVVRAERITIASLSLETAGHQRFECHGFEARAIQHELDHLDGKLFLDRVVSPREVFRRKVYK